MTNFSVQYHSHSVPALASLLSTSPVLALPWRRAPELRSGQPAHLAGEQPALAEQVAALYELPVTQRCNTTRSLNLRCTVPLVPLVHDKPKLHRGCQCYGQLCCVAINDRLFHLTFALCSSHPLRVCTESTALAEHVAAFGQDSKRVALSPRLTLVAACITDPSPRS